MAADVKLSYRDVEPNSTERDILTDIAQRISDELEYAVCDTGNQPTDQVTVYGMKGWSSTPFQNAGTDACTVGGWLWRDGGGCPLKLLDVSDLQVRTYREATYEDCEDDDSLVLGEPILESVDDLDIEIDLGDIDEMDVNDVRRAITLARWAKKQGYIDDEIGKFAEKLRSLADELANAADELD